MRTYSVSYPSRSCASTLLSVAQPSPSPSPSESDGGSSQRGCRSRTCSIGCEGCNLGTPTISRDPPGNQVVVGCACVLTPRRRRRTPLCGGGVRHRPRALGSRWRSGGRRGCPGRRDQPRSCRAGAKKGRGHSRPGRTPSGSRPSPARPSAGVGRA